MARVDISNLNVNLYRFIYLETVLNNRDANLNVFIKEICSQIKSNFLFQLKTYFAGILFHIKYINIAQKTIHREFRIVISHDKQKTTFFISFSECHHINRSYENK